MPRGGWLTYLRPQAGSEIPASFRLTVGAISGAALSLSYTGLYLSIYSWVCVGILLFSLFDARPRVAFGCGFLHGLLFVLTSLPWIATVLWVAFEFVRAHLPEISFPWNLLGYPAAANLGLVQVTTITGVYGLSFLVAGFNSLLTWTGASIR